MRPALALIVLGFPTFIVVRTSLFDPSRARVEEAFERAEAALRAQARRRLHELPKPERDFVRLLPVGHWKLLVEAHPDVAFERCFRRLDDGFPDRLVASWGIHALARLRDPRVKPLLLRRAESADFGVRAHAIRLLRFYADPALTPRLLSLMPPEGADAYEENEVRRAVLDAATWSRPPDPAVVERELQFQEERLGIWAGTDGARLRLRVLTSSDPLAEAERGLFPAGEGGSADFEEWVPTYVSQRKLVDFAPLLRRRIDGEIVREKTGGNEAFLDPEGSGRPLDPQDDAFWGFRGPFLIAAYRQGLRDLGVPLGDEERSWLDRHRLLRPPREYLREAGIAR